MDDDDDVNY